MDYGFGVGGSGDVQEADCGERVDEGHRGVLEGDLLLERHAVVGIGHGVLCVCAARVDWREGHFLSRYSPSY